MPQRFQETGFIYYSQAFDCVNDKLWVVLKEMGAPRHFMVLIHNRYCGQEAIVGTEYGETERFPINKGVYRKS